MAAKHINKDVSFILDIGGQDMKAIFHKWRNYQRIEINEACSSDAVLYQHLCTVTGLQSGGTSPKRLVSQKLRVIWEHAAPFS